MEYRVIRTTYNDELYHFGVKGMKWGVRRYQNADGSLTPAGQKRAAKQALKDDVYREKQLKKTARYYDKNRHSGFYGMDKKLGIKGLEKSITKNEEKYAKTGKEKFKTRADDSKAQLAVKKTLKKMEMEKVKNLTHDQIQKERTAVGKAMTRDLLVTVGMNVILLPTTGISYGQISSAQSVRSRTRWED